MSGRVGFCLGRRRPLAIAALLLCSPGAYAACSQPSVPPWIAQGSTATQRDMLNTQAKLKAYAESMSVYWRCLFSEYQQGVIGRDKEEQVARRKDVVRTYNEGVNELQGWSDCYNAELGNFKRTGGGQKAVAADCTPFLERAKNAPSASQPSTPAQNDVVESPPNPLPTGAWRYGLSRGEQTVPCVFRSAEKCNEVKLRIDNASKETLECSATLQFQGTNNEGQSSVEKPAVSRPGTNRTVLSSLIPLDTTVSSQDVQCKVRHRTPAAPIPGGCTFRLVRSVNLSDYYPPASRRLADEGPVVVQFTLPKAEGAPAAIQVVESSLFDRLDAAALRAVGDMGMTTDCPGTTFRMLVDFKLD